MSATWDPDGQCWMVELWSAAATAATVLVIDRAEPTVAHAVVGMAREGDRWVATVAADLAGPADLYGFRVDGPRGGSSRFDPAKLLLDPEAAEVWFPPLHDRDGAAVRGADTIGRSPFGVLRRSAAPVVAPRGPRRAPEELVIYELHVRGATMLAPHVPAELRGTFAGLRHHVGHIAALGVTAVELMPVHQFDPAEPNYWGYMPLAWNALHHRYVAGHDADAEFAEMVAAFHDAGIEVLLDVVYNHTTEEDDEGPTYHLRGIDDTAYYVLHPDGTYRDDAGCGNVVRAAHPAAEALILGSLRRYADLGVDGFRFDLGTLLGRDLDGQVQTTSAVIDAITAFASARDLRLITEPWDLAAYQLGAAFPGHTWGQWNGKFRDDARSFLRAENGAAAQVAHRIEGSPDLFGAEPARSINFITAHDGFTLYDVVSYESKHNAANGHGGTDGTDDNRTWNCGWEGDDIPADRVGAVMDLRAQQTKNAMVLLMLSAGVPMMVAGDEFGQTQGGNNNPYNQDNTTTWLDWTRAERFAELTAFVQTLLRLRAQHAAATVLLHGVGDAPDLSWTSHSIAWQRGGLYVMMNAWWEPLQFRVQADGDWTVALSTATETGPLAGGQIKLAPRSSVVLARS
ncbi:MAG TPA: alpha-amylase family glycosyl hydrolase [Ilumatobacteraceae bacterium]